MTILHVRPIIDIPYGALDIKNKDKIEFQPKHTSAEAGGFVINVDDGSTFADLVARDDPLIGGSGTAASYPVPLNPAATSPKDELTRIKIYALIVYNIPIASFTMDKLITAAKKHLGIDGTLIPFAVRESNFAIFKSTRLNKQDPWGDPLIGIFKSGTSAYNELKIYSETDYGSLMIDRINKSALNFTVYSAAGFQAMGNDDYIRLPPDYPKLKAYPFSNQPIDAQATIHHEFEHTRFGTKSYKIGSLIEEVTAVIEFENPARIIDGFEPRYVYYQRKTNTTVSVLDHTKTMPGGKTFNSKDPRILK